ncbi:MAG: glycosyltransferase family 2 protein [Gemmatimonadales bacterium]
MAVVIPAFQAAGTIGDVVARTRAAVPDAALYVVDDGSTDATGDAGRGRGALVLTHPRNRGKGEALRAGIARACADGAAVLVTLDADGQHPPELIPALVTPLFAGGVDLVLGARRRGDPMPVGRRVTNWLSARLASRIGGQDVRDAQTGFRAFTWDVGRRIRPTERHYDFETAFLLEALAAGCRVTSVPIPTLYDGARSHFRPWADTWRLARVFARHARRIVAGARAAGGAA